MPNTPLYTVFTPTYDRGHTIHRVYDSLCAQTLRDFEWLVIDDGSTDGTSELIATWAKVADFPIRYFRQPHAGKHIAHNLAVREARGQFFAPIDSDDALFPDALEKLYRHWNAIPISARAGFSGMGGLCCDQHGAVIGDRFPTSPYDADMRDVVYVRRMRGERWGVTRTDLLRQYPFPEIAETQFVPEVLPALEMADTYKRRFTNELVRVYYVDDGQIGATLSKRANLGKNSRGRAYYYAWILNHDLDYFWHSPMPFIKAAAMLPIVAKYSGRSIRDVWGELRDDRAKWLVLMVYPFAVLLYWLDRARALFNKPASETGQSSQS
jgi:glycosyltransferase involved in cell wall biosynthesis